MKKNIIDYVFIVIFIIGMSLFIIGTLLFTYKLNIYLGLALSGIYFVFFSAKALSRSTIMYNYKFKKVNL